MSKVNNAKFLKDLERYIEQQTRTLETVITKTILGITTTLVLRSPVGHPEMWSDQVRKVRENNGYEPGKYISSWNIGLDFSPAIGYNNAVDTTGQPSISNATRAMTSYNLNVKEIAIVNTAVNETTGEYYPKLLELNIGNRFAGYRYPLDEKLKPYIAYDLISMQQDGVLGSFSTPNSKEFISILTQAVRSTK